MGTQFSITPDGDVYRQDGYAWTPAGLPNKAEVRTANGHVEIRVNGLWNPSSREEIDRLLAEGWLVHWNPSNRPITLSEIKHLCRQF